MFRGTSQGRSGLPAEAMPALDPVQRGSQLRPHRCSKRATHPATHRADLRPDPDADLPDREGNLREDQEGQLAGFSSAGFSSAFTSAFTSTGFASSTGFTTSAAFTGSGAGTGAAAASFDRLTTTTSSSFFSASFGSCLRAFWTGSAGNVRWLMCMPACFAPVLIFDGGTKWPPLSVMV